VFGARPSAVATLVDRATRYTMVVALPDGNKADAVADALAEIGFVPLIHTTFAYLVEFLVKRCLLIFDGATGISHSVVDGIV